MINKTIIQGRLAAAPELATTPSGISTTSFTVVNSKEYKDKKKVLYLRCTAWRELAEFLCRNFTKGQEIIISGEIYTRQWEKDGVKRSEIECEVNEASFCGPKITTQSTVPAYMPEAYKREPEQTAPIPSFQTPAAVAPKFEEIKTDDDLPF